jgi:hypothetical protein
VSKDYPPGLPLNEQDILRVVFKLRKAKYTDEKIAEATHQPLDEIKRLKVKLVQSPDGSEHYEGKIAPK